MNKVKQSGLWPLVEYNFMTLNSPVITTMVERWHPETNSFHLLSIWGDDHHTRRCDANSRHSGYG
ncbi:hypothetical protein QJS04_geneDACA025022 [Acorus gramineus]|uniref:Uncharacterized protein n=1 Tax=Acorus gramineus TaxID=55184 RepID=A0AAV9A1H8_ACOGR|nr:hypothetical protein QJS04_geneDACA025022 [Acorus gramineus]